MEFKKDSDTIWDKIILVVFEAIFLLILFAWLHMACLAFPGVKHGTGRGINCAYGFAYKIPYWLHIGLKVYHLGGFVALIWGAIRSFLLKNPIDEDVWSRGIILYFLINFILIIIVEYLNDWRFFS